jgi:hypothetical protein
MLRVAIAEEATTAAIQGVAWVTSALDNSSA